MNFKQILFIFAILTIVSAVKKNYRGYSLYKVIPKDDSQVETLQRVQQKNLGEFWMEGFEVNHAVKVMVSPENSEAFLQYLRIENINATEIIKDIQKAIDDQLKPAASRSSQSYLSYSWTEYHDLETTYNWLDELETNHPDVAKTVVMGQSVEGRDIKGIIINYRPERDNKLLGVLEGTLHAREWISTATVTWIIKEFLTSTDPEIRALAESFEWHIFPIVNPDGFNYTFHENRMWRKNRSPASARACADGIDDDMSHGVDLNRNFDVAWMSIGASDDPCTNTYAGPSAFSEPESQAIAKYMQDLSQTGEIIYYIAYHSYTQLIIIPYSHVGVEDALLSGNYPDMYEIAIQGADAARERYGTEYRVGLAAEVLYPMSGSSFDWVKYALGVPITYLIELRDLGEFGFLLPASQIIPTGLENMDALVAMDKTAIKLGYYTSGTNSVLYSTSVVISLLAFFLALFN